MGSPLNSLNFKIRAVEGLELYKKSKKTVCFLTVSQAWGDNTDIFVRFRELNRRVQTMTTRKYIPNIEYIGVRVIQLDLDTGLSRQHLHMFWKKPFLQFEILKRTWEYILKDVNQPMTCKTVTMTIPSIDRVVGYCLSQNDEHYTGNIVYTVSSGWGIVGVKSKVHKSTKTEFQKLKRKSRIAELKDSAPWMIKDKDGKEVFLSDSEYEQYKLDNNIG